MTFKIITADERIKEKRNIKGVIFGPHGIGKTSLLNTLPDPSKVLFLNLEAGDLSVQDWPGISINISTWEQARDMACLVGGPDPAAAPINGQAQVYGQEHYNFVAGQNPDLVELLKTLDIHFWDSISVASRLCFRWSEGQPESFSERTGKKGQPGNLRPGGPGDCPVVHPHPAHPGQVGLDRGWPGRQAGRIQPAHLGAPDRRGPGRPEASRHLR